MSRKTPKPAAPRDHALKPMRTRGFGDALRWTVDKASIEFGLDTKTLVSRLSRTGTIPGADKKYSTAQICAAVFGDQKLEYIRGLQSDNALKDIELAKARGEVVPVQAAFLVVSNMLFAVRRVIEMSALDAKTKDGIYAELQGLKPGDFVTEETTKENK